MTTLKHTIKSPDVVALRADLVARGRKGVDVLQGLRTELSGLLQLQCPPPASSLTPEQHAERTGKEFTHAKKAAHLAAQIAQLTNADHEAFGRVRGTKDPDVVDADGRPIVHDAHHYAQKLHGKALWAEVDRLIAEAGIT